MAHFSLLAMVMVMAFAVVGAAFGAEPGLPGEPGEPMAAPHPFEALLGSRIQRTMTLLETSDEMRHPTIRVLCYGQSIVAQGYVSRAIEKMAKERYPHAKVEVRNSAIGGYTAPTLVRPAIQDIAPWYPDLVVFHVYDGEDSGELERIVRDIRTQTTAELLMWTHHFDFYGTDGTERDAGRDHASNMRRLLAQKYGAELVELREEWRAWLAAHPQINRKDLLTDNIHLNARGGELMAELVMRHFRYNTLFPSFWADRIRGYEVRTALEEPRSEITLTGSWKRWGNAAGIDKTPGTLRLAFRGNRVTAELWPVNGKQGHAKVLIDGRAPSQWQQAYAVTRSNPNPLNAGRPMCNRLIPGPTPIAENWTIHLSDISEDGKTFKFTATGSVTGPDGEGTNETAIFTSKSGRISFEPRDITLDDIAGYMKKPCPKEADLICSVVLLGTDEFTCSAPGAKGDVPEVTLIQGIPNGEHVLEIVTEGDGPVAIKELTVHRPPVE